MPTPADPRAPIQPVAQMANTLQSAYAEQYTDAVTGWREIGGKHKAANILRVCQGRTFSNVLECGAGEGSILKFLDASGAFTHLSAAEISDSGIRQIEKRGLARLREVRKFNGYELPWGDKQFDMAYCSHVLEHVEHPRLLLRELKRISAFQVFEIPLDYAVGVDAEVTHFLSYGHINVFTPSLFRFLLKSEGYAILDELLSHTAEEVVRYNWYRNMGLQRTFGRELQLRLFPLRRLLRRLRLGESRYREYGYSAYTCLAQGAGALKIF